MTDSVLSVQEAKAELEDPDRGYIVLRNWFSPDEVVAYRERCQEFLERRPPVIYTRINTENMVDYVHPRSHDLQQRTFRIYQYFHNHIDDEDGHFFEKIMSFRRQIEACWSDDSCYVSEQKRLQDYIIVTKYVPDTGLLPRHRDYGGPAPHPLLQTMVPLSQHGKDYSEGDFMLYTKSGRAVSINGLKLDLGDCLLFDKSLDHEVETVRAAPGSDVGRWSVLVGARAARHGPLESVMRAFFWRQPIYNATVLPLKAFWQSLSGQEKQGAAS